MEGHEERKTPVGGFKELEPIAIIGMSCRLPAEASDIENLWTSLAAGQSGWSPHPAERLFPERFYHPNPDKRGTYYAKGAHYQKNDISRFDAQFFSVTAAEAVTLDPQQRQLLELSYEAIENAGLLLPDLAGSEMGVFVGGNYSEYRWRLLDDIDNLPMFDVTGNAESLLSNRLSYAYDLRGPSLTIDTACSSSLVALNTAFQSLQAGESSTAIVASSVLRLSAGASVSVSNMKLLSPDGKCYSFDDRGTDGFGRGEGTACIILKPLRTALEDGDPIRAVIRNTGVNQDGKTAGITMPNGQAQSSLIESVYRSAGLDPSDTDFVEAHGTGTAIGDPIEAAALAKMFGRSPDQRPVTLGSIKSNFGHLEAASGVTSVIKAALMLERKFLIPNCDLRTPKREIPFEEMRLKVSSKYLPWDSRGIRRVSVNNFGFGGTNAHAIMEETISKDDIRAYGQDRTTDIPLESKKELLTSQEFYRRRIFFFSANDRNSLERYTALVAKYLFERMYVNEEITRSLARTFGERRTVFPYKIALTAAYPDELISKLRDKTLTPIRSTEHPRVGFVFTGQGAGWAQMGVGLSHEYPIYASAIQKAEHSLKRLGAPWSLTEELAKPEAQSIIDQPHISQPVCTALQIALVDLLSSWGLTPWRVTGHSSGEIAAAYAAGALDLDSCIMIAYYRGVVAAELITKNTQRPGAMSAIGASQETTEALIHARGNTKGSATIACFNSPNSMTVSGDSAEISRIAEAAEAQSIWNRRLNVNVAYHSHHMDTVADRYASFLGDVKPNCEAEIEFHSSLEGQHIGAAFLGTSYWVNNLISPVKFTQAFTSLCKPSGDAKRGVDIVLEIGPHSTLQGPIRQTLQSLGENLSQIQTLPTLIRKIDNVEAVLASAARLLAGGCKLKLRNINFPSTQALPNILTDLPLYQWNHEKEYWHRSRIGQEMQKYSMPRHDLLGVRLMDCGNDEPQWKNVLLIDDAPWLRDHVVQNVTIFPAAAYLCMAIEACRQKNHWKGVAFDRMTLREVSILQPLVLLEGAAVELRLSLVPLREGANSISELWSQFKISSWASDRGWLDHCRGLVAAMHFADANPVSSTSKQGTGLAYNMPDVTDFISSCTHLQSADELYQGCEAIGFSFGPTMRLLQDVRVDPSRRGTYTLTTPDTSRCMPSNLESQYLIHPVNLDGVIQGSVPFIAGKYTSNKDSYMPVSIRELVVSTKLVDKPGSVFRVMVKSSPPDAFSRRRHFDCVALDTHESGQPCGVVLKGLTEAPAQMLESGGRSRKVRCLRTQWEPHMSYLDQIPSVGGFWTDPPISKGKQLSVIESLGDKYIGQAIRQISPERVPRTYLQRLYDWMKSQISHIPEKEVNDVYSISRHFNNHPPLTATVNKDSSPNGHLVDSKICNGNLPQGDVLKSDPAKRHLTNGALKETTLLRPDLSDGHLSHEHGPQMPRVPKAEDVATMLMHRVGQHLPAIVQGEIDPVTLMSEDDILSHFHAEDKIHSELGSAVGVFVRDLAFQNPNLRILEVGACGTAATAEILASIDETSGTSSRSIRYDFADQQGDMSEVAKAQLAPWASTVAHKSFDLRAPLAKQKVEYGIYDLIIAWNLGNTIHMGQEELLKLHSLLSKGGRLIILHNVGDETSSTSLLLRIFRSWWSDEKDDLNNGTVGGNQEEVLSQVGLEDDALFQKAGFTQPQRVVYESPTNAHLSTNILVASTMSSSSEPSLTVVVFARWLPEGMTRTSMENALCGLGVTAVEWIDIDLIQSVALEGKYCLVIDDPKNHYLTRLNGSKFESLKNLTQAPGILWATGGLLSPDAGLVRGFARTIRGEFQMDKFVTLAVDDWDLPGQTLVSKLATVIRRSFLEMDSTREFDRELALKNGVIHIPRIVPDEHTDKALSIETQEGSRYLQPFSQEARPLTLTIPNPGFLDTLSFDDDDRVASPLAEDEIEIDIKAFGLNFKDILLALGQLPGYFLGQECSGIVAKVGNTVSGFKPNDRVCAILPGSMSNRGRCKADCAVQMPNSIGFAAGASLPLIYCTAQYCLVNAANLKADETILIHTATGGVGQAAVMLAQALGAKILATVGSIEKKKFLMDTYNIPEDSIFYSRDDSFAQDVLAATNGRGVDVVLNSLAGEQLRASWKCVAPFGRFIEIGKKDIVSNNSLDMSPFERTVTFTAVDLGDIIEFKPQLLQTVFTQVMDLVRNDTVRPVSPIHEYAVSEVETAFRSLQSGRLIGKIVIVPQKGDMVMAARPTREPAVLREDVSYLITGGTGGIGRAICVWMAQQGAKNIILASRSGKRQVNLRETCEELSWMGVTVEIHSSDVSIEADLRNLISDCAEKMPPIGGVIHGAYVNKDAAFEMATYQDWEDVVRPKYYGAWNLHNALKHHKLDFFVMLSSTSGIIGNRGQAAYAAANSFLDDFAHFRASQGLPGTSIDLGVVKEIGHVAERPELQERLEALSGDDSLSKADVLALVKLAIKGDIDRHSDHQCIVGLGFEDYNERHSVSYWATDARFCHLRPGIGLQDDKPQGLTMGTREALRKALRVDEATRTILAASIAKFSNVLLVPAEEINADKSIVALGLDSLVAIEVRSWVAKEMDAKVSTLELMTASSIRAFAELVVERSILLKGLNEKAKWG